MKQDKMINLMVRRYYWITKIDPAIDPNDLRSELHLLKLELIKDGKFDPTKAELDTLLFSCYKNRLREIARQAKPQQMRLYSDHIEKSRDYQDLMNDLFSLSRDAQAIAKTVLDKKFNNRGTIIEYFVYKKRWTFRRAARAIHELKTVFA